MSHERYIDSLNEGPIVPAEGNLCGGFPARYVLALLGFMAMAINTGLRVNINVLMISMINHTVVDSDKPPSSIVKGACADLLESIRICENGEFTWSPAIQGLILSSYYWTYMIGQIPGGTCAEKYSAKWVILIAVAVNIIATFLTPVSAELHYTALILIRLCQGLTGASLIPAFHVLLSRWAPPAERGFISSLSYAGLAFGNVIALFFAGFYAKTFGWELIFYIMAAGCVPWCILWIWLVQDHPTQQRYISETEREYIITRLGWRYRHPYKVPWKSVSTSGPFWAILVAHVLNNWTYYLFLIDFPIFITQVLKYSLRDAAIMISVPFLLHWLFSICLGIAMDWFRFKRNLSTTAARKISTSISSVVPAICIFINTMIGCQRIMIVILLTIGLMSMGAGLSGFFCNHIDIAHYYAGTLMALTNTVATIPAIIVPNVVGYLIYTYSAPSAWMIIYYLTIAILLIEFFVYVIFASGEEEEWNQITQ